MRNETLPRAISENSAKQRAHSRYIRGSAYAGETHIARASLSGTKRAQSESAEANETKIKPARQLLVSTVYSRLDFHGKWKACRCCCILETEHAELMKKLPQTSGGSRWANVRAYARSFVFPRSWESSRSNVWRNVGAKCWSEDIGERCNEFLAKDTLQIE